MAKGASTHPPYLDMITEAIVALKDRNGSSLAALKKYIGSKWKLPDGWDKKLSYFLKKLTAEGKLVKVRASWKLGEALRKTKKEPAKSAKPAKASRPATAAKAKPKAKKPKTKTSASKPKAAAKKGAKPKQMKKKLKKKAAPKKAAAAKGGKGARKGKPSGTKVVARKPPRKPKVK